MVGFSTDVVVRLIEYTAVPLPDVRRRALMESVRAAGSNPEAIMDMLFDVVSTSPYLDDKDKAELAEAFLRGDMSTFSRYNHRCQYSGAGAFTAATNAPLLAAVDVDMDEQQEYDLDAAIVDEVVFDGELDDRHFTGLLEMVRLLFAHSRKLRSLPPERRAQLMLAIQQARSVEHIRQMVLQQLPTALSLDRHERQLVANDILDGRYYNLLLPDRLDCHEPLPRVVKDDDDAPRRRLQASNTECPICLNELGIDYALTTIVQCCGQRFCTACVVHLTRQHQERQNNAAAALCPLCRTTMMTTTTTSPLSSSAMICCHRQW
jgi:hypothetical protein